MVASTACGTPLSNNDIQRIVTLSDYSNIDTGNTLQRLETAVARNTAITKILVDHRDRRGLFAIGLDAVEHSAVMPLQRDPAAFQNPEYAHRISLELLRRFLVTIHAEFTGAPTTPSWTNYFALTARCELSPARVAMAGYSAHLVVDLAHSVAAVHSKPENAPDYFKIVDAIAQNGNEIVAKTKAVYNGDLGPLWRFYFLGEGLDALVGQGVATPLLLRAVDVGVNTVTYSNGLALQDPRTAPTVEAELDALWRTTDVAWETLSYLGGL